MNMLLKSSLSLAALAFSLGACASPNVPDRIADARTPTEHFAATATGVEEEIALAIHPQGLSPNQATALLDFLDGWREAATGGTITVQVPAGGADSGFAYRSGEAVRSFLQAHGVAEAMIRTAGYDAAAEAGAPVRVGYTRYQVTLPRCGREWTNIAHSANNEAQPNFGCAVTANMAAQIANPADLVRPAEMGPSDAQRRLNVLEKYRKGENTSSAEDKQAKGAISSVAP